MKNLSKTIIVGICTFLVIAVVGCSSSPSGARIVSFRVEPLTITEGETVTVTWEVAGSGPLKVMLNNEDVSDKDSMTFQPTRRTGYRLIVEGPYLTVNSTWRVVTVEPAD